MTTIDAKYSPSGKDGNEGKIHASRPRVCVDGVEIAPLTSISGVWVDSSNNKFTCNEVGLAYTLNNGKRVLSAKNKEGVPPCTDAYGIIVDTGKKTIGYIIGNDVEKRFAKHCPKLINKVAPAIVTVKENEVAALFENGAASYVFKAGKHPNANIKFNVGKNAKTITEYELSPASAEPGKFFLILKIDGETYVNKYDKGDELELVFIFAKNNDGSAGKAFMSKEVIRD